MGQDYSITGWVQQFVRLHVKPGDVCIDATAGNGNDTLFLCSLCTNSGKVLAFDIQKQALLNTEKLLTEKNCHAELILDSHVHMKQYADPEEVSCIMFNFGYLPGADHSIATKPDSSVAAIEAGLTLLKKEGIMTLCIYSGKDTGFAERDAILDYVKSLDSRQFIVITSTYFNRPNNPPIPVFIIRVK